MACVIRSAATPRRTTSRRTSDRDRPDARPISSRAAMTSSRSRPDTVSPMRMQLNTNVHERSSRRCRRREEYLLIPALRGRRGGFKGTPPESLVARGSVPSPACAGNRWPSKHAVPTGGLRAPPRDAGRIWGFVRASLALGLPAPGQGEAAPRTPAGPAGTRWGMRSAALTRGERPKDQLWVRSYAVSAGRSIAGTYPHRSNGATSVFAPVPSPCDRGAVAPPREAAARATL